MSLDESLLERSDSGQKPAKTAALDDYAHKSNTLTLEYWDYRIKILFLGHLSVSMYTDGIIMKKQRTLLSICNGDIGNKAQCIVM